MEQLQAPARAMESECCAACQTPVAGERCDHCGCAVEVRGLRVEALLAQTPHSRVYRAQDRDGRVVALKELLFALVPTVVELEAFEREAKVLESLSHPRIPRQIDAFRTGSGVHTRFYLVQEFVPGESLAEHLARLGPQSEVEVLRIAREVLGILSYLHGRDPPVLHRDLKPANFIRGSDASLTLVDFGIARPLRVAGTHGATLVGTLGYMPPEQLGGTLDLRSDLHALGATLLHLLTGRSPEAFLVDGLRLQLPKSLPVSRHALAFLKRLVAAQPRHRFASAKQALHYLEHPSSGSLTPRRWAVLASALLIAAGLGWRASHVTSKAISAANESVALPPRASSPVEAPRPPDAFAQGPFKPEFGWQRAKWNFRRAGRYAMDESGRGHAIGVPVSGARNGFFGLELDGRSGFLEIADHADFALQAPFSITVNVKVETFPEGPNARAVILERSDASGAKAYGLELLPGRQVRFVINDAKGHSARIQGVLLHPPNNADFLRLYVTLDNDTGELTLLEDCQTLARTVTSVRPMSVLPGSNPGLRFGGTAFGNAFFHGELMEIFLERGVYRVTSNTVAERTSPFEAPLSPELLAHMPKEMRDQIEATRARQRLSHQLENEYQSKRRAAGLGGVGFGGATQAPPSQGCSMSLDKIPKESQ